MHLNNREQTEFNLKESRKRGDLGPTIEVVSCLHTSELLISTALECCVY